MIYIYTVFDNAPIVSFIYDSSNGSSCVKKLKCKGNKYSNFLNNKDHIIELLYSNKCVINNVKQHYLHFGLDPLHQFDIYEIGIFNLNPKKSIELFKQLINISPKPWMKLYANSELVYGFLQEKGLYLNGSIVHPNWGRTYSDRSKTSGISVQGLSKDDDISNLNGDRFYINLDWVSADLQMAAYLSQDSKLAGAIKNSDPYQILLDMLDDPDISRNMIKVYMLSSIYNMQFDDEIFVEYNGLSEWLKAEHANIEKENQTSNVVGRKYVLLDGRSTKSIFNAKLQGSVAACIRSALYEIFKKFPNKILLETHDSITLTANKDEISDIIKTIIPLFKNPLKPYDINIEFKTKISISEVFKDWSNSIIR